MLVNNINGVPFVDNCNFNPTKRYNVQVIEGCGYSDRVLTFTEITGANTFDCEDAKLCINTELGLPNAGSLTNFASAVVSAYESHIAAGGADPEFAGEVLATLQSASPALVTALLNIINNALLTSPNPLLSNLCSYINDCIDTGLLVVSADAGNIINTGTDGGALLLDTDVQSVIKHTIKGATGVATLNPDDIINFTVDSSVSVVTVDETVPTVINVKIPATAPYVKAVEIPTPNTRTPIIHNLNTPVPGLYAYDSSGEYIDIEWKYIDTNTVEYRTTTSDSFTYYIKS